MPVVQFFSVNIKQMKSRKKFYFDQISLLKIMDDLEQELPGIKEELFERDRIKGQYTILVEEEKDCEKRCRCIKDINESVTMNSTIKIFPVLDAG